MDDRTIKRFEFRIQQLENKITRAINFTKESEIHLKSLLGLLQDTKYDFKYFRSFYKWKLQKFFQNHLQLHIKNMI